MKCTDCGYRIAMEGRQQCQECNDKELLIDIMKAELERLKQEDNG